MALAQRAFRRRLRSPGGIWMENQQAKASVIVTLFNKVRFIEQTLRSAIEARCEGKEIVVVDDGSTDGSTEIAHKMAEQHKEIRVIRNPKKGSTEAMNYGVEQSRSAHIFV